MRHEFLIMISSMFHNTCDPPLAIPLKPNDLMTKSRPLFFTKTNEDIQGPFTGLEIKELAQSGQLLHDSHVRKGSEGNWTQADQIKELSFGPPQPNTFQQPSLPVGPPPVPVQPTAKDIIEDYDKYAEFTKAHNWNGLCKFNNVELDSFATKKELNVLPEYLEPGEVVFALTSGLMKQSEASNALDFGLNTWLVVLTSERFLFLDAAMLSTSVDTQSIRHDRVQAVSASQGWVLGKIMVDLGSRVLTIDNCKKATVKVIADLANKWIRAMSDKATTNAPHTQVPSQESPVDMLEKLAKLHVMGALTDDEFRIAKEKILSSL